MIAGREDSIREELQEGSGAAIGMSVDRSGLRTGLRFWFADLNERHGPVAELRPYGLRGYRFTLGFGNFAGEVIRQIRNAGDEDVRLARALVASVDPVVELDLSGQDREDWMVTSGEFKLVATLRQTEQDPEDALVNVCRNVIVPVLAAMAELIGYDVIDGSGMDDTMMEGGIFVSLVLRRERNPRNRLLCIRLHGERCACCGIAPRDVYGDAGNIIEVHHLEALSLLEKPRPYDPAQDLVPLCPNCHRAAHTRRPVPWSIPQLRDLMSSGARR